MPEKKAPAKPKAAKTPKAKVVYPKRVKGVVPESIQRRRKIQAERKATAIKASAERKVQRKQTRVEIIQKTAAHEREYRALERIEVNKRREARANGNFYVPDEPRLALVIRIRGVVGLAPKPRKVLQLMRLRQINNAVFIRMNKSTMNMLRLTEPNVAYGYPTLKTIRMMVYKRGFANIKGQRIPITDNTVIEEHLGKYGVKCMEDIVHEIYTVGPHFKEVNNFLWYFKLKNPKGGFRKKTNHYVEGGDFGNREDLINPLAQRMI